jgi:hypothetical protein
MSDSAHCDECRAILQELMNAFAELRASTKAAEEFQGDASAFLGMLRQADEEESADPAKGVLGKFQFRPELPYSPLTKSDIGDQWFAAQFEE